MNVKIHDYARLLVDRCKEAAGSELEGRIKEVLKLMQDRGDAHLARRFPGALEEVYGEQGRVQLDTAAAAEGLREQIASALNKHLEDIEYRVDESLIGGAVLKIDNTVIDASVKGHLQKLRTHLVK